MTWTHYSAWFDCANGERAHATIECDKNSPNGLTGCVRIVNPNGIAGLAMCVRFSPNDEAGELRLVKSIKRFTHKNKMTATEEEFTRFSNTKHKTKTKGTV